MPLAADAFFDALERQLPAVIGCGGDERLYVDDTLDLVRTRTLSGGLADFNHDRVSARDKRGQEIVNLARTLPVMAPRRLVEVRDAEALDDASVAVVADYLQHENPETVLLFVFGKIDLRDKLAKLLDKEPKALFARFEHPRERDMPDHVRRRARRHKLKIDGEAAQALAVTVGADLTLCERALEKLALVAGTGEVTVRMISEHVADTHIEEGFDFARAVAKADLPAALSALARLEAGKDAEPLALVGTLAWQLRQVVRARLLLDEGKTPDDVGRAFKLFGDRQRVVVDAARLGPAPWHERRMVRLAATDRELKSHGSKTPWLFMARLVQDLCVRPAGPAGGARGGQSPRR